MKLINLHTRTPVLNAARLSAAFCVSRSLRESVSKFKFYRKLFLLETCFLIFFASCFSWPVSVFAEATPTSLYAAPINATVPPNTPFTISVGVSSGPASINTIGGDFHYPADQLSVQNISNGGSVINFWIDQPKASNGDITFSGIIPGGYFGPQGKLFDVTFAALKTGDAKFSFDNIVVLANDGKGTNISAVSPATTISVKEGVVAPSAPATDTAPPEPFSIVVTRDPNLFDNQPFAVFSTQDKGSGVDHYEVKEGDGPLTTAESPYQLTARGEQSIVVRAIDRSGNIREATWTSPKALAESQRRTILIAALQTIIVVIALLLLLYVIRRNIWRKKKR